MTTYTSLIRAPRENHRICAFRFVQSNLVNSKSHNSNQWIICTALLVPAKWRVFEWEKTFTNSNLKHVPWLFQTILSAQTTFWEIRSRRPKFNASLASAASQTHNHALALRTLKQLVWTARPHFTCLRRHGRTPYFRVCRTFAYAILSQHFIESALQRTCSTVYFIVHAFLILAECTVPPIKGTPASSNSD